MLINPYIYKHLFDSRSPIIVETLPNGDMYIGDCLPNCTSYAEHKWLIKLIVTTPETGLQQILFANGSTHYDQAWTERKSLKYSIAPDFDFEMRPADADAEAPNGALATKEGVYIITADNRFIVMI